MDLPGKRVSLCLDMRLKTRLKNDLVENAGEKVQTLRPNRQGVGEGSGESIHCGEGMAEWPSPAGRLLQEHAPDRQPGAFLNARFVRCRALPAQFDRSSLQISRRVEHVQAVESCRLVDCCSSRAIMSFKVRFVNVDFRPVIQLHIVWAPISNRQLYIFRL